MRVVNVAHGEFFMLGAVIAWFVADAVPGPPALGFAAALVVSPLAVGAIAVAADRLVLKRLDYDPEATIVATIGLLYILQQARAQPLRPRRPPGAAALRAARCSCPGSATPATSSRSSPPPRCSSAASGCCSPAPASASSCAPPSGTARPRTAFGIDVDRVYAGVFGLGAALAALAAVLIVPIQQAHYLMGGDPLLLSFIVVIVGGLGILPRHRARRAADRPLRRPRLVSCLLRRP